jgi:hypothetical protein
MRILLASGTFLIKSNCAFLFVMVVPLKEILLKCSVQSWDFLSCAGFKWLSHQYLIKVSMAHSLMDQNQMFSRSNILQI